MSDLHCNIIIQTCVFFCHTALTLRKALPHLKEAAALLQKQLTAMWSGQRAEKGWDAAQTACAAAEGCGCTRGVFWL